MARRAKAEARPSHQRASRVGTAQGAFARSAASGRATDGPHRTPQVLLSGRLDEGCECRGWGRNETARPGSGKRRGVSYTESQRRSTPLGGFFFEGLRRGGQEDGFRWCGNGVNVSPFQVAPGRASEEGPRPQAGVAGLWCERLGSRSSGDSLSVAGRRFPACRRRRRRTPACRQARTSRPGSVQAHASSSRL